MSLIPQYLKATDPATVAAVKANDDDREALVARIIEFRDMHGAARAHSWGVGGLCLARLEWDGPRPDGWKKDGTPYQKNADVHAKFRSLRYTNRQVPGLPRRVHVSSGRGDGQGWLLQPSVFEHDGAAFAAFGRVIDTELVAGGIEIGEQWVECLSSEYAAAQMAVAV